MSNHTGSYMINDILKTLEKISVFEILGREKSRSLVLDILEISTQYDCNPGEVLQDIGEKLGYVITAKAQQKNFMMISAMPVIKNIFFRKPLSQRTPAPSRIPSFMAPVENARH